MITNEDTFRSYPSKIAEIYNNWPKVEDEGTNLSLTPVRKGKMILEATGNTSQKTTTGKNLFSTKMEQGGWSFTTGNKFNSANYIRTKEKISVTPGETYTLSFTGPQPTGNASGYVFFNNDTYVSNLATSNLTFTVPSNANQVVYNLYGTSIIPTDASNIQIEQGSNATSYEEYTGGIPSPNPDYPQEVINATGEQVVKVVAKNLFNDYRTTERTFAGVTTSGVDGGVKLDGTYDRSVSADFWLTESVRNSYNNLILLKANTTYTVKVSVISGTFETNYGLQCNLSSRTADENKTFAYNYQALTQNDNIWSATFTTGDSDIYAAGIRFTLATNRITTFNNTVFHIQIEKGSTATEYEAYKEQSYTINLGSLELCKIENYKDRIYYNNGKWYLEKKIGKYTFTGNENWNVQATDNNFTTFQRPDILPSTAKATNYQQGLCKSNYFKTAITWNIWTNTNVGIDAYVNRILITIPSSIATTKAQLNQWLQGNNVYLYYVLDTPTTEEITSSNYPTLYSQLNSLLNAKSYDGTTNIIITGVTPVNIKAAALMKGGN